jgi:4-aminobutyrate aminotransferase-like enzyme
VLLQPPLVITSGELSAAVKALDESLKPLSARS